MRPKTDPTPSRGAETPSQAAHTVRHNTGAFGLALCAIALGGLPVHATGHPAARAATVAPPGLTVAGKSVVTDPTSDTLGTGTSPIDLTAFSAVRVSQDLVLGLTFHDQISPPESGAPNAVYGFVELDTDRDSETGRAPFVDFLTPWRSTLGTDLYIPLHSYRADDRAADLVAHDGARVVGRIPVTIGSRSIAIRIPETLLTTSAHAAAVVGNQGEVSDVAPNGGFVEIASASAAEPVRLLGDRFAVDVTWRNFSEQTGAGSLVFRSPDSAVFWFFRSDNWELMVKIIDGCSNNGHFWAFAAATTNVAYSLTITDVATGTTRRYDNSLGSASAAVTDTRAFATCP